MKGKMVAIFLSASSSSTSRAAGSRYLRPPSAHPLSDPSPTNPTRTRPLLLKVGGKGNGENSHSIKKDDVVLMINEVTLNKWGIDCFEDFVQFLGKHKARPLSMTFGRKVSFIIFI